jgi:hypothetical protein
MIKLEASFRCVCPGTACETQLDAANWETALAEVRLMRCRNGGKDRYLICELELAEYDEKGRLADLDLLSRERRKIS